MCYAVLKVSYRNSASPTYLEVEQKDQLDSKLDEVKNRAEVQSVAVFNHDVTHRLVPTWQVATHE
ncbi:MAG TPA: hypothetical protein VN679_15250 [Candidatus Acidoferrales bacterium]|nr:hypothetical protein [Candidatus Acidoferrales bacterium]